MDDVNCSDKIFLLSLDEVFKYKSLLRDNYDRLATVLTRTKATAIIPIYDDIKDEVVAPKINEDLIFNLFHSEKEVKNYFTSGEYKKSYIQLWSLIRTIRAEGCCEEVRAAMKLKLNN